MMSAVMIVGREKVEAIVGYWPSFHDANVMSFEFHSPKWREEGTSSATMVLNYCESKTVYSDAIHYEFVRDKDIFVTLMFRGVEAVEMSDFHRAGIIDELRISETKLEKCEGVLVEIEPCYGLSGIVRCASVEVVSVEWASKQA